MAPIIMGHGASGCFGTRLAPASIAEQVRGGLGHTEQRFRGNRHHDSNQRVVCVASTDESVCRLCHTGAVF